MHRGTRRISTACLSRLMQLPKSGTQTRGQKRPTDNSSTLLLMISNRSLQQRTKEWAWRGWYSTVQGKAEHSTLECTRQRRAQPSTQLFADLLRPCRAPQEVNVLHFNPHKIAVEFQPTGSLVPVTSVRHKVRSGSSSKHSPRHSSWGALSPAHLMAGEAVGKSPPCMLQPCAREIPQLTRENIRPERLSVPPQQMPSCCLSL